MKASTLATTGCASRSTAGVAIGLGVVTAVTGVAIAASDDDEPPPNPNDAWAVDIDVAGPFGAGVALIGVALIATGVVSLAQISSHEEAAEASQPPVALAESVARSRHAHRLRVRAPRRLRGGRRDRRDGPAPGPGVLPAPSSRATRCSRRACADRGGGRVAPSARCSPRCPTGRRSRARRIAGCGATAPARCRPSWPGLTITWPR
jgi:hypothetical protein